MKTKIVCALLLFAGGKLMAQKSCCAKSNAAESFAMLTNDVNFVNTHLNPIPFVLENPLGKMVTFKTSDGKESAAYEIKATKPTDNYVFVIHEWWGLNDYIKHESEKIAKTLGNVNVIALDLYDKKVANNRDSAAKYMQSVKAERAESIIKGALAMVGTKAKIATIGWCFGGGWSMQAALLGGTQTKACVMYYGAPEENVERIKTLSAPIFFVWPSQDQWINKEMVSKFEKNMKAANKSLEVKTYDADHAFANPSNPKYSKAFAEDAFKNVTEFIAANLK
jgi:carboxymethylenebutenolidase